MLQVHKRNLTHTGITLFGILLVFVSPWWTALAWMVIWILLTKRIVLVLIGVLLDALYVDSTPFFFGTYACTSIALITLLVASLFHSYFTRSAFT
jgi:hypothetical protein